MNDIKAIKAGNYVDEGLLVEPENKKNNDSASSSNKSSALETPLLENGDETNNTNV